MQFWVYFISWLERSTKPRRVPRTNQLPLNPRWSSRRNKLREAGEALHANVPICVMYLPNHIISAYFQGSELRALGKIELRSCIASFPSVCSTKGTTSL